MLLSCCCPYIGKFLRFCVADEYQIVRNHVIILRNFFKNKKNKNYVGVINDFYFSTCSKKKNHAIFLHVFTQGKSCLNNFNIQVIARLNILHMYYVYDRYTSFLERYIWWFIIYYWHEFEQKIQFYCHKPLRLHILFKNQRKDWLSQTQLALV